MLLTTQLIGFGGKRAAASGGSTTTWQTSGAPSGTALTNGNLTATGAITYWVRASAGITSGKIYWECSWSGTLGAQTRVGWATGTASQTASELGDVANCAGYTPSTGSVRGPGNTIQTQTTADRCCIAYDYTNGKIYVRKNNGSWNNTTDDPATNTGGITLTASGTMYPAAELFNASVSITAYFDSASWLYSAPSGFSAMP
jgi:hypothetical protein